MLNENPYMKFIKKPLTECNKHGFVCLQSVCLYLKILKSKKYVVIQS